MLRKIGLFLGPLLFIVCIALPRPEGFSPEGWRVIAIAAFMLVWWITEAVPLAVASLLPIVLLPLLGVSSIRDATTPYANPVVFLFMGGFMIALAMEKWNLHRRIALNIVKATGTNANGIIFGFFLATAAISMWISNTATAVMMLPIATSVIALLSDGQGHLSEKGIRNFALGMMLAIAYGSNIGGTATIIGTPPNVVFAGFMRTNYDYEVSFAKWMLIAMPFTIALLLLTYFMVVKVLYPNRLGNFTGAEALIRAEVTKLGRMSRGEKRTLAIFLTTALLWIFREGVNALLPGKPLTDEGIAMLATVVLFITPVVWDENRFVLEWRDTERLPWGILLLFGGGLSLAGALANTGIIDLIGEQFRLFQDVDVVVVLGLATVSLLLTEVMSNVALVTIFLPMVGGIAQGAGIDPLEVCIPVTMAASCAFMLPMSTPPNAIVFASGHVTIPQMLRVGIWLNIATILLISFVAYPLIKWVF
ncbi:MAG TPA: DASS family sodium-coupled anion symporter [Saprospiraceae bacterium]|nr:DASS family sodium-coupled anion symporter [Saprospiraceae bacterium]HMP22555.1 DASS family sodium-coupled anion symporter [Saprospiraceae bacterium]